VLVAFALHTAHVVEGLTSHSGAWICALLSGVFAGLAAGICPWLIPILWGIQIGWIVLIHRRLKNRGWFGVRRTILASTGSLLGFLLVIGALGGWVIAINAWSGLQIAIEARIAADWMSFLVAPTTILAAAVFGFWLLGMLLTQRTARVYAAACVVVASLAMGIGVGNRTALLVALPLLPIVWYRQHRPTVVQRIIIGCTMLVAIAAVGWAYTRGLESYRNGEGTFNPAARARVVARMQRLEGGTAGLVLTNHTEHELLMAARRKPATPFLNGAIASEARTNERLRKLALNRVDQSHKNAPLWVVWNLAARNDLESLESNPTLAVWVRSNCVLAIPDEPGVLGPYDLYYCGLDRDRFR